MKKIQKTTSSEEKGKNIKNLFFSGVLVLTLSNIIVKVLGAFLKVPLASSSLLGNEGIGYYQAAYEIYVWFYTISTVGLPIAVSIMISGARAKGRFADTKRMFKVIFAVFAAIGVVGTAIMASFSALFARAYNQPIEWCILVISPTLLLVCISSAYRGYFQGYQSMTPTAISEVIEAVGKFALGIIFAKYAINRGYPLYIVAAYALVGLTVGTGLGMVYLFITKRVFRESDYNVSLDVKEDSAYRSSAKTIIKTLFIIGIPITISSSVMSLTNVIDGMILSNRLQWLGYSQSLAIKLFGNYKALAVTMFNLPPALIYPISASIVPLLSRAVSGKDHKLIKDTMNSSLKITAIIALPCAFGLSALSKPLLGLLFKDEFAVNSAAPLLSVLAPSIFFLAMLSITNSFLQAHGHEKLPIISMIAGAVMKLLTTFVLIGLIGKINGAPPDGVGLENIDAKYLAVMFAAPIGTFLCYLATMLFNFFFVAKKIGFVPKIGKLFIKPFIAALCCAGTAFVSYYYIPIGSSTVRCGIAVILAALVYLAVILLSRTLEKEDIMLLPKGERIYKMLHKLRFV
ncbi:MAG: polysaccharide biosynthesis protein [Clostridia bacterium]|nr:polysaccharide biosynthesis protein [Clostridia bacterium]